MFINPYTSPTKFVAAFGTLSSEKIVSLLEKHKVIVPPTVAKLLQDKAA